MTQTIEPPGVAEQVPVPPARSRSLLVAVVPCVLGILVLHSMPAIVAVAALLLVLGVPALVLRARVSWGTPASSARTLYAFGAAVALVILAGLVINTALPLVAVERPLRPVPLVVAFASLDTGLLLWRRDVPLWPTDTWSGWIRRVLDVRVEPAQALALASLLLAVAGAVRLNNDAGGGVALAARILAALGLLLLLRDRGARRDTRTLGLVAASLLAATSLRGWSITGHDIQREYIAFLLTNGSNHWSMAPFQSAYNACLSVNILPTVLAQTTGLSGVVVFKVLMQGAMVVVPVATYLMSRRLVSRRVAVLASIAVMMFPTFFNDMPYLVRQEVAFLFLSLLVLVATERSWSIRRRRSWICIFGVALVLSHYSTTYMLLIGLVLAYAGVTVAGLVARRRSTAGDVGRRGRPRNALVSLPVIAVLVGASWAWAGPATHTAGHVEETARQTFSILLGRSPSLPGSSDLQYNLFSRDQVTPEERLRLFAKQTYEDRRKVPAESLVVQDPGTRLMHPQALQTSDLPLTGLGRTAEAVGVAPHTLNTVLRTGSAALLQVLLLIGVIVVLLRPRLVPRMSREMRWLAVGSVGAAAVVVLVPSLSAEYGALRAFQQALLVLAPVVVVGADALARWLGRWAAPAVAAVWAAMFLSLTGIAVAALGGYPGQLSLENSGLYYDLYYVRQPEINAAAWIEDVNDTASVQSEVVSDKVSAARLQRYLGSRVGVSGDFYPLSLQRGSYVYLGAETVTRQRATVFYTGTLLTYRYPVHTLDNKLDIVFSTDLARVYR